MRLKLASVVWVCLECVARPAAGPRSDAVPPAHGMSDIFGFMLTAMPMFVSLILGDGADDAG